VAGSAFRHPILRVHVIRVSEQWLNGDEEGVPLFPYRSGWGAWIAKGPTKLSWSTLGEVRIEDGSVSLVENRGVLASCPVAEVSIHSVPIWFGMGVKLKMGEAGRWYVQPQWSPRSPRAARRATRIFKRALAEAQRG